MLPANGRSATSRTPTSAASCARSANRAFLDRFRTHTEISESSHENGAADARLLAELENLVATLPPEERRLVERKYFGGESVRDLATTLQTSEKAVESRLSRVRRKLKESLLAKLKHEATD